MAEERKYKILLIADKDPFGNVITKELNEAGFEASVVEVEYYGNYDEVLTGLIRTKPDLVIATNNGIPPGVILEIIPLIKRTCPGIGIMVLSGYATLPFAKELKKLGVHEFFALPYDLNDVLGGIKRILHSP